MYKLNKQNFDFKDKKIIFWIIKMYFSNYNLFKLLETPFLYLLNFFRLELFRIN